MKKIIKITDIVDNHGGTEIYEGKGQITMYLDDPSYWSDDAVIEYEENGVKSVCFIDELVGATVLIEDEEYEVEED